MAAAFVAAVESAAFVVRDLHKLIEIGFWKIPADSRVARAVKLVCDCYDQGIDWREARQRVLEDSADLGWFQAPANVAFVVLGLLYGEGDFKKSIILAINCSDDTDCTGATIGSIMGILYGTSGIPADWRQHIGDEIATVYINKGAISGVPSTCAELTERVCRMIPVMLSPRAHGISASTPKRIPPTWRVSRAAPSARGWRSAPVCPWTMPSSI